MGTEPLYHDAGREHVTEGLNLKPAAVAHSMDARILEASREFSAQLAVIGSAWCRWCDLRCKRFK